MSPPRSSLLVGAQGSYEILEGSELCSFFLFPSTPQPSPLPILHHPPPSLLVLLSLARNTEASRASRIVSIPSTPSRNSCLCSLLRDETTAGTSHRVTCTPFIDDQIAWSKTISDSADCKWHLLRVHRIPMFTANVCPHRTFLPASGSEPRSSRWCCTIPTTGIG